jgi:hypothetical protein
MSCVVDGSLFLAKTQEQQQEYKRQSTNLEISFARGSTINYKESS